jgi:hypothetical protein
MDVLEEWQKIVAMMAREGEEKIHVVFNMIDAGEYWDAAV